MKMNLVFSFLISSLLAQPSVVPFDSSNVVIVYYGDDANCRSSNAISLEIRSPTQCYEDAMTECMCNADGTIDYTEYLHENCTDEAESGNFAPDDMGCMQMDYNDTDSTMYYRYYCYDSLPESLDPYTSQGHSTFPYIEEIYNSRSASDNCTDEAAAYLLIQPDTCFVQPDGEPVIWQSVNGNKWNIRTFEYNDTDCSGAGLTGIFQVDDETCDYVYGFDVTFESTVPAPTDMPVESYQAEFSTNFQLSGFPCDEIDDLENNVDVVAQILEAGYAEANSNFDGQIVIDSIEPVGDSCSNYTRRLQDAEGTTDLDVSYTTYCESENVCVDLEEETTAEFLEETLIEEMEEEFDFELEEFSVVEESVTTTEVTDENGDTVKNKSSNNNNDELDAGAVAGIVIGVVVFVVALGGLLFWYFHSQKEHKGQRLVDGDEVQMHTSHNVTSTNTWGEDL